MTLTFTQILILLAALPIIYYGKKWVFKRGYQSRKHCFEALLADMKWVVAEIDAHVPEEHYAHLAMKRLNWIEEGRSDPYDVMDEPESDEEEDQLREAEEISEEQGVKDLVGEAPVATLTIGDSK